MTLVAWGLLLREGILRNSIGPYRTCRRQTWIAIQGVLVSALCGCGDGAAQQQLDLATQAVQAGLDAWKRGEKAATLKASPAAIDFFDDDWQGSARLVEYEVLTTYLETDGTPRCAVRLVVQRGTKPPEEVQVTYQLVTKENETVIARDPFS